ncbi:lanthionine synthetase C family protein [Nocardiopsis oceani]
MTPLVTAAPHDSPGALADHFAANLATPVPAEEPWQGQSLAQGAAGTALLHVERAHTGLGSWQQAHRWIRTATAHPVSAADTAGLYLGAPAIAFTLEAAARGDGRYREPREALRTHVRELAHRRAESAMERIHRGDLATFAEYDTFYGLTGLGAHLLAYDARSDALERVLTYLVALTRPQTVDGRALPGWWVSHDPHRGHSAHFPGGHANLGTAHGITGVLALLSQAARRGATVDGHHEAIATIGTHLDTWRQDTEYGPWWPEHLTADTLDSGIPHQQGPGRPSWCYGTPGIARAGQLAAIATGDPARQSAFEDALSRCLSDSVQLGRITDTSLCHGWAGLYQTTWRAAQDAVTPALVSHLPNLARQLRRHAHAAVDDAGFLEGGAGTALALMTVQTDRRPRSRWDSCLLID